MGVVSKGLKNEFETAEVNEPSVFEPLKFCCKPFDCFGNQTNRAICMKFVNLEEDYYKSISVKGLTK